MITIYKNTSNIVVLTLSEKTTLTNPIYLCRFVSDITKAESAFICSDNSLYIYRYNRFTIIDNPTPLPLSGQMNFTPVGEWTYYIYEQTSASNLDYTQSGKLLETGKVNVVGSVNVSAEYQSYQTYKVYGN